MPQMTTWHRSSAAGLSPGQRKRHQQRFLVHCLGCIVRALVWMTALFLTDQRQPAALSPSTSGSSWTAGLLALCLFLARLGKKRPS